MEDRATPHLYFELVDLDRETYLETRAHEILARGAERLTCWENLVPDRDDLPRRLDEFGWLAVYEVDSAFEPPPASNDVAGFHFARTARPGQGHLRDTPTLGLLVVLISPREPAAADALRAWADFIHIRQIAEAGVPGYTMITPYESVAQDEPRFLHLYEMDTLDAETTFQRMTPMVAERLGGYRAEAFRAWTDHDALRIDYVSTFRRIGEPHRSI